MFLFIYYFYNLIDYYLRRIGRKVISSITIT